MTGVVPADRLLAFAAAAVVVIVVPGPSVLFVIGRALAYGRRVAVASVVGNTIGLFTVMTLVALGLGALVARSVVVFTVVKIIGAVYLVWLGCQAIRHRFEDRLGGGAVRPAPPWSGAVRQGYLVGVGNPKGFMLFAALLPQFVDRTAGRLPSQMLLLGTIAVLLGLVCDLVWAVAASRLRDWLAASPRRGAALGVTGGVSMIGLGIAVAVTGRPQ